MRPMATCYRHPTRETNVSCSNCGRPICPDCMTSTSVGMRCPECASQRTKVRNPVGAPTRADAPATYAIIGICVAAFVAELVGGGTSAFDGGGKIIREGGLFGPAGRRRREPYRIVTSAFLHAGLLHLGLNMFALYILGRLLEPAIGTARFVGIYAVSILGGSFGALLLDPNELTVGASGAIFGLMAAAFLIARSRGLDELASQIGFFVILNLVFTFSIPNISIGGHLGGLVGGALAALLINALERGRTSNAGTLEAAGLLALCAVAVVGGLLAADVERSPRPRLSARCSARAGSARRRARSRSRAGPRRLGVQEVGEQLDPVDEPRAGARERGGGVDRDHPPGAELAQTLAAAARLRGGLVDVEAARHRDDDLGLGGRDLLPGDDARLLAGTPETSSPPARAIISGTQWPPTKTGSSHSSAATRGRSRRRRRASTAASRASQVRQQPVAARGLAGRGGEPRRGRRAPRRASRGRARAPPAGSAGAPATARTSS